MYVGVHLLQGSDEYRAPDLERLIRRFWGTFSGDALVGRTPGVPSIEIRLVDPKGCSGLGQALSRELACDSVCIVADSVVDSFAYWRFSKGKELRCLIYGVNQEGTWEVVRGRPESWEDRVLFRTDDLEVMLKRLPANQLEEHRRVYQDKVIRPGNTLPFVSFSYVAKIAGELGLVSRPSITQIVSRSFFAGLGSWLRRRSE